MDIQEHLFVYDTVWDFWKNPKTCRRLPNHSNPLKKSQAVDMFGGILSNFLQLGRIFQGIFGSFFWSQSVVFWAHVSFVWFDGLIDCVRGSGIDLGYFYVIWESSWKDVVGFLPWPSFLTHRPTLENRCWSHQIPCPGKLTETARCFSAAHKLVVGVEVLHRR